MRTVVFSFDLSARKIVFGSNTIIIFNHKHTPFAMGSTQWINVYCQRQKSLSVCKITNYFIVQNTEKLDIYFCPFRDLKSVYYLLKRFHLVIFSDIFLLHCYNFTNSAFIKHFLFNFEMFPGTSAKPMVQFS